MLDSRIVQYIKLHAKAELKGKDENFLNGTRDSLNAAFQKWKLEHGNRDVKYKTAIFGLSDLRSENKINSFDEAEPWECTDLAVPTCIGLAVLLQQKKYPDYIKIVDEVGSPTIYALLIQKHTDPLGDHDLFFAYAIMVEQRRRAVMFRNVRRFQQERSLVAAGKKQLENLAKGSVVAGKRKSERANEYHKSWKTWAREACESGPAWWSADDVLDKVCFLAAKNGHKMANGKAYSRRTIRDVIAGEKKKLRTKN